MKNSRNRNGYYKGCYKDIDAKDWTLGETLTLKELLDQWWNSVRIKDPKSGEMMCCYKTSYTRDFKGNAIPPYEDAWVYGAIPKSLLNKKVKVDDEWDDDGDGYPIVGAVFVDPITNNKKFAKIRKYLTNNNFSVNLISSDESFSYWINIDNPGGCDYSIEIDDPVNVDDFISSIMKSINQYDPEEEFKVWYGAGRGEPSNPGALWKNCEAIGEELDRLEHVLNKYIRNKEEK